MRWKGMVLVIVVIVLGGYVFGIFRSEKGVTENINEFIVPTVVDNSLKVAIMADVHSDYEQLMKMLAIAKVNKVEMVIVAGDLSNRGSREELMKVKNVLDESGLDYRVIPGDREKKLDIFKDIFGKNYQSVKIGEVKFILIDNSSWHGLGKEQKLWIESEVSECGSYVCIVVMHKVLNNLFSTKVMGENNAKVEAEANWLRELFIESGVKRIAAGDLHYATSYELEGIRTDIVGAISREDNTQSPRYTELVISKDFIDRRVIVEEENDTGN